jgi:hypothetical protein
MIKKQIMKDYVIDITDNIVSHCVSTVNKDDINITSIIPIIKLFIHNYLTINTKKQNKKIIDINDGLYNCLKIYDGNIQLIFSIQEAFSQCFKMHFSLRKDRCFF